MPGIVGFVTNNPDQGSAALQLSRMLQAVLHDPSYSVGTFVIPDQGCYLGWVHHKGSYAAGNPIVGRQGDVVLVFTGEHFSHHDEAHGEGRSGGARQEGARSLMALWERKGEEFIGELNGWFAGVLVDRRKRSIVLFNDRFGVHRIYCHEAKDTFTFASEAKSILSVRPETRALDPQAVGQFMGFGAVFDNRTLFSGISLLPAGSSWVVDRPSAIKKSRYFCPRTWEEQPPLTAATFQTALRETISSILPAYFRSATPVGLSLTGGLDTRIVTAGVPAHPGPIRSYTYAGIYRDCFDVHVAGEVATACGLPHDVINLGPDFFRDFDSLAAETVWLTDGCLDICGSHEIYFSKLARKLSPVRLTGNYGSEILRSASTFKLNAPPSELLDPVAVAATNEAARSFAELRAGHPVTFAAFKDIPWNLFGRLAAAQSQLVLRSPYMDNALVALLYRAPAGTRTTNQSSLQLIAEMNPRLASIGTDMAYGGDRAAPVATLRRLCRYIQFKAEWYYNAGMPQWAAKFDRTPLLRMLEPLFLGSHKIDHYRLWFQHQLMPYVRGVLSDTASRSRPYLNRRGYDDLMRAHTSGRSNRMSDINKVITLELVHRHLIERDYGA